MIVLHVDISIRLSVLFKVFILAGFLIVTEIKIHSYQVFECQQEFHRRWYNKASSTETKMINIKYTSNTNLILEKNTKLHQLKLSNSSKLIDILVIESFHNILCVENNGCITFIKNSKVCNINFLNSFKEYRTCTQLVVQNSQLIIPE